MDVAHVGWHRPTRRAPWIRLATGKTWRSCWLRLIEVTAGEGEMMVLPVGNVPVEALAVGQGEQGNRIG